MAHNDLKGLLFFHDILEEFPPTVTPNSISARMGEYTGIRWQAFRYITGVLHEIIKLIIENEDTFKKDQITIAISKLEGEAKESWELLLKFVNDSPSMNEDLKKLRNLIRYIRDNSSFHYFQPKEVVKGYKTAFEPEKRPDGLAYFCRGNSMQETRYHFADAAMEDFLLTKLNNFSSEHTMVLRTFISTTKIALHYLVFQYLKQIQADITHKGPGNNDY